MNAKQIKALVALATKSDEPQDNRTITALINRELVKDNRKTLTTQGKDCYACYLAGAGHE